MDEVMRGLARMVIVFLLAGLGASPIVAQSDITVAIYTRHTLRGVSERMPPGTVEIPAIGLTSTLPALSYEMNATADGLEIARRDYPPALNEAVSSALKVIGVGQDFDGRWDAIRADLATQRTFETALHIRRGLGGNVSLEGCPTEGSKASDPVTSAGWVTDVLGREVMKTLPLHAGSAERLQAAGEAFVQALQKALTGEDKAVSLPPLLEGSMKTPLFESLTLLATSLEMSASQGAPFSLILGRDIGDGDGAEVVAFGLSMASSRWVTQYPEETGDLVAWPTLNYIATLPSGRREILVGHDEQIFCIKQSLGLVSFDKDLASARVYPMETLVFVQNAEQVVIVGMRMQYERNGQTKGKFQHSLLWQGTVTEWDARITAVKSRLQSSPFVAKWLDTPTPPPVEIRVLD